MRIAPLHPLVQIAKLRCKTGVELDHRQALAARVVEKLHIEKPVGKADGSQKALGHVQRPGLHLGSELAGVLPAHKSLGAGVHQRIDHAQRPGLPVKHPAVEVELRRVGRQRVFQHQAVGALDPRQPLAGHPVKRLDQAADDPQLAPAKPAVRLQLGMAGHLARQHRERRLHRLDIARVGQAEGHVVAIRHIERGKADIGLGGHLLQHAPGMQLVLGRQHRLRRGTGQAQLLGHQRGGQRAKLLVV